MWAVARILPAPGQCKRGYLVTPFSVTWRIGAAPTRSRMLHSIEAMAESGTLSQGLLGGSMRIWWSVGLVCTLLAIAMSATLGHRACVATAEAAPPTQTVPQAAQHPALEGSQTDGAIHLN